MRFFLDNDVDHACLKVFLDAGHEAWTTSAAARSDADDESQVIYAIEKGAVLVTCDQGIGNRECKRTRGRVLVLRVHPLDAPERLTAVLEDVTLIFEHRPYVVIEMLKDSYKVRDPAWG